MTTKPTEPISKTVILVSGFARAGKDTFADGLLDRVEQWQSRRPFGEGRVLGFYKTAFAYPLKSADQCPDGPRYKACGNSMAVPVMRWIGEQIARYEAAKEGKQS